MEIICTRCKDPKDEEEFRTITIEEFDERFEKQFGLCKICQEKLPEKRKVHVDHSHKTGEVRGLLCSKCNTLLGMLEGRENIIGNIVDYLME